MGVWGIEVARPPYPHTPTLPYTHTELLNRLAFSSYTSRH
jgi:hypothetical protein